MHIPTTTHTHRDWKEEAMPGICRAGQCSRLSLSPIWAVVVLVGDEDMGWITTIGRGTGTERKKQGVAMWVSDDSEDKYYDATFF